MQTPSVGIGFSQLWRKFFADRGTHLAAMVAYFALLSFVPLVFLALALFGLTHRADASDFFVNELKRAFPGASLDSIVTLVHHVQDNATTLGIIGGVGLLWSSLSLFSALESALNIVYGLPNRGFLHGKGIAAALMSSMIAVLFTSLVVGALGVAILRHSAPGVADNTVLAYTLSIAASLVGVFVFLLAVYRWLPNTPVSWTEALPGAILGAVALEVVVPGAADLRPATPTSTSRCGRSAARRSSSLWLYVMANVIVFGGELNWWWRERRRAHEEAPAPPVPGGS